MYSEQDLLQINARIKKNLWVLLPVLAVLIAIYVAGLVAAVEWLVMVMGALIFVAGCYGIAAYLLPNVRYRRFLLDMQAGLSRDMRGRIVSITDQEDLQDGVRVLPVHIFLESEQDERIVYLNASKSAGFPQPGTDVELHCYGRHIRDFVTVNG